MRVRLAFRLGSFVAPAVGLLALLPAIALSWHVLDGAEPSATAAGAAQGAPVDQPNGRFFADEAQFAVECGLVQQAAVDPIVHPGHAPAGHLHDFFGSVAVDEASRGPDLVGTATTCRVPADTAAYWAPSLVVDGRTVTPDVAIAYYRVAPGVDPEDVEAFPMGLAAVAGRADATGPQDPRIVGFSCGRATIVRAEVPTCPAESPVNLRVTFPDCWDGERLDAPDHRAHLAYSAGPGCPPSHPSALPRLTLVIHYPLSGELGAVALTSGPVTTAHADFLNGWEPDALARQVRACLHREVVCAIPDPDRPGRRADEPAVKA